MRHPQWHYGSAGFYFVTICTYQREYLFDTAEFKQIASHTWQRIPSFKSVTTIRLDEWVIMPNHLHGILVITDGYAPQAARPNKTISGTIGATIAAYKSAVAKQINCLRGSQGARIWQRGYYDRIVRNEKELHKIQVYIKNNPLRWQEDPNHLDNILAKMNHHL